MSQLEQDARDLRYRIGLALQGHKVDLHRAGSVEILYMAGQLERLIPEIIKLSALVSDREQEELRQTQHLAPRMPPETARDPFANKG